MDLFNLVSKELNLNEVIRLSKNLGKKVCNSYNPDFVVGISEGGTLVSREVSRELEKPFENILLSRNIDLKKSYESYPFFKPFLQLYQGYLFLTKNPEVIGELKSEIKNKNILLVDDTIHTGKTFDVAKNYLFSFNPNSIKTASLFKIGNSSPDFYIGNGRCKFPWSKNSNFYEEYNSFLKKAFL